VFNDYKLKVETLEIRHTLMCLTINKLADVPLL